MIKYIARWSDVYMIDDVESETDHYITSNVSIDGARRKMIELEKIESLLRGQQ
jgi:hypothetical protein